MLEEGYWYTPGTTAKTVLAAAAAYGAGSITVNSGAGFYAGQTIVIGSQTTLSGTAEYEVNTVGTGYVSGSTTVPVYSPLHNSYNAGALVSDAGDLVTVNAPSLNITTQGYGSPITQTIDITSAVAPGNDVEFINPNARLSLSGSQFSMYMVFAGATDYELISQFTLQLYDHNAGTYYTLWDPDTGVGAPPTVLQSNPPSGLFGINTYGSGAVTYQYGYVFSWSINGLIPPGASSHMASQFKLTWANSGKPPTQLLTSVGLLSVFMSGNLPYGVSFSCSFANSGSGAESPAVVLASGTTTPPIPGLYGIYCPGDGMFFDYQIYTPNSLQYASGVDTMNVYAALPGSTQYAFATTLPVSTWNKSGYPNVWTQVGGALNSIGSGGVVTQGTLSGSVFAPDAFSTSMPIGSCLASGSGRLLVGSGTTYWFSESGYPLRFRLVLDVENGVPRTSSGGYATLPNTERCAAWAVSGAAALGTNSFYLFTNQSTYSINGPDGLSLSSPTLLASVGCSAPGSVAVYQDAMFFLDDNLQIRKFSYGQSQFYYYQNVNAYQLMQPISKRVVDDQTHAIPARRIANAVGCATYDRYYFAYSQPSGTTNSLMLVWDETIGSFVQDTPTLTGATVEAMCPCVIGGQKSVYCQSSNLQCYEWETVGASAAVSVSLASAAMNPGGFGKTFFGRVGIVADIQSTTLNVKKTLIAGGNAYGTVTTDTSTIDMSTNVSGGQVFRWDSKTVGPTTAPAGMDALTCQLSLGPIPMTPGARIFAIVQEQPPATPGADAL